MENLPASNQRRHRSRAVLAEVKRKLETDAGSPLLKGSGSQSLSPKRQKRLPIPTLREMAKSASPVKVPNTVSFDATKIVEPDKVHHDNGMEPALNPHKGPVQVTTISSLLTVQHPLDCKKIEQLVSAYEQHPVLFYSTVTLTQLSKYAFAYKHRHKHNLCVYDRHKVTWADSDKGKAWAKKGKVRVYLS